MTKKNKIGWLLMTPFLITGTLSLGHAFVMTIDVSPLTALSVIAIVAFVIGFCYMEI